jgi:asparagine N-glycosylation enzyme membrane subunit Stt3
MNSNWYGSLTWYKENSQELSPLATWWDYGYWIYNVADRPSLADGSNAYYTPDIDLGRMLSESNETLVKEYLVSKGTRSVLVDSSMLGKFYWISSIGLGEENGVNYAMFLYQGEFNTSNGLVRAYQDQSGVQILVTDKGVIIGRDGRFALIEMVATQNGYVSQVSNYTEPHLSGAVVLAQDVAVLIPPSISRALYTQMFLLDGVDLKEFDWVYDNGEIKMFSLK